MSPKKNVLLTTSAAPSQSPFSTIEKRPPLGIGFLISILRDAGHEVFFIDNYLRPSNFLETGYLSRNQIQFVGIYANTICYRDTLRMLYKLEYLRRSGKWEGQIIVGGPHTTVAPDTIPDFVDYVVQGEGERAIIDIVEGRTTDRILRYPPLKDLDKLPMPAWDYFVNLPYKWTVDWFNETPVFTMNTSRGCPFHCAFCSVGSIWGNRYTHFSAERIVSDIEHLIERYNAKGIYFREDNFTLNKARLRRFCNLLIDKNVKIYWSCESRVNTLDRESIELMHRAGARGFYFGVESGSQRILDFLNKGITVEQTRNVFKLCHEFGIKTAASVIVGVPTETEEDVRQTEKLIEEINPTVTWNNVFVGIPDSKLYNYVKENKLYEFIDDRRLLYLKGHNDRARRFYGSHWNSDIPVCIGNPKISVVMAVYNGDRFLESSVKSVLSQTFQNFEFIIVNDASTDGTAEILGKFDDPRIKLIKNAENLGLTKSLNKGIAVARGKYIARMDADDISLPHRFEIQADFLDSHTDYALIGSSYYQIDENGHITSVIKVLTDYLRIKEGLIRQNWFGHGSVMMRKDVFLEVGGYDERFKFSQDYDLWVRIADNHKVANCAEPLYSWRATTSCISNNKKAEQRYYADLVIVEARKRRKTPRRPNGPMVSVIVPTFNRPESLRDAINSILRQTYGDFEIVVVNDAGIDVEGIVASLNVKNNIKYLSHSGNSGLAAARNTAIKAASGKYIAYLDDDDIYYPDHLETLVGSLENSTYKVAYTDAYRAYQEKRGNEYVITKRDLPYSFDFDHDRILKENFIPVLCVMHERSCFDKVGLLDADLKRTEDWDLWIRMSRDYEFQHIEKITCEFRWREDASSMMTSSPGPFAWAALNMFHKYRKYVIGKPEVALHQRRIIRNSIGRLVEFVRRAVISGKFDPYHIFGSNNIEDLRIKTEQLSSRYPEEKELFGQLRMLLGAVEQDVDSHEIEASGERLAGTSEKAAQTAENVRLIAFYLPQYHPIPENDRWWGKGFTEWTNVRKAEPLYSGHYQPHVPSDLGYYDLRNPQVREAQAELARRHGLHGFCYYHYWFQGRRLMNLPIDEILETKRPDFPFCLCWANEHWTRAWDGRGGEILMEQRYSPQDDREHIRWLLNVFRDRRYIRINGRPLMLIYLPTRMPDAAETVSIWREEAARAGEGLYLCKVESAPYECYDPALKGFDAAVEFQPDWGNLGRPRMKLPGDHLVFDYGEVARRMLAKAPPPYKRFPGITPMWDNSPRRRQASVVLEGSTPALYEEWLSGIVQRMGNCDHDENLVFINAWNEWGEGNHLEPDERSGLGYLEATRRALTGKKEKDPAQDGIKATSRKPAGDRALGGERVTPGLVSIVILTFNGLRYTKECIESIRKHTPEPHEIIFVDNGSADGTLKWLRKLIKRNTNYKLIENGTNLGYSKGCNKGIGASSGEYILLLNNDVVVTGNWLSGMIECINTSPDTGIVGPMTNSISGPQRVAGVAYSSMSQLDGYAEAFRKRYRHRRVQLRRIVGFCMLFRRSLADEIGLLDAGFGTGNFEDDDYCLRAAVAGRRNLIAGDVFVHHYGSRSFIENRIDFGSSMSGNRKIFAEKWGSPEPGSNIRRALTTVNAIERAAESKDKGRLDEAVKILLEALAFLPGDRGLHYALAEMLIDNKKFKEAEGVLGQIGSSADDLRGVLLRGHCLEGLERIEESERYADLALSLDRDSAPALNLKGLLAHRRGDKPVAEKLFRRAADSDPGYGEPFTNLGLLAWAEGRHEEAISFLETGFIHAPQSADGINNYYQAVTSLTEWERAEPLFRDAAALHPLDQRLALLLIDILIRLGKAEEAMPLIEDALATFGVDDGMLEGALAVRRSLGPRTAVFPPEVPSISLCMIAKNEERNIARSLASVKSLVHEMIVVDTRSTDRTRDIAEAFGAKVYDLPWTNDFSAARNASLEKAAGEWILILDADETISPRDHEPLLSLLRSAGRAAVGYAVTTRSYTVSQNVVGWSPNRGDYQAEEAGSGWFPGTKVRIFRRNDRIRFVNPVHEAVEPALAAAGIPVRPCRIPIHHYGKLDETRTAEKGEAYYQMGLRKLREQGDTPEALRELAVQARELGKFDEALSLWRRLLLLDPDLAVAHLNIGSILLDTGHYKEALEAARHALKLAPEMKEAALNCALAELYGGDPGRSIRLLEDLKSREPDYATARVSLTLTRLAVGKGPAQYERGMESGEAAADVARRLISAGRFEYAARLLEAALEAGPDDYSMRRMLRECEEHEIRGAK